MGARAKAADDMAEAADGLERGVEPHTADRVVDEGETLSTGMGLDIAFDALIPVDRRCAQASDVVGLARAIDGIDIGTGCLGDLDDDVSDTARADDQQLLPGLDIGAEDKP